MKDALQRQSGQCPAGLRWQIKFESSGVEVGVEPRRAGVFLPDMSEVHHATVFFSGRVQGVGFRYSALQVAREFDESGCVQNLPDGRVQLEAEGSPVEVRDFIVAIQERMAGYIRKVEQTETQRAPKFQGFSIR